MKKISKSVLINSIIDYVFKTYCDDETIAGFAQDYYDIERRTKERLERKTDKTKKLKPNYKITKEVRDFLEPLVDAEYHKLIHYTHCSDSEISLYDAMEQLNTRQQKILVKKLKDKS